VREGEIPGFVWTGSAVYPPELRSFSMMEFSSISKKPFPVWFRVWVILSVPYELLRFLFTGHLRFGHVSGRWAKKLL
jgi:hypothetical protein